MNSKTSLFDKGIYKATVRRNVWGSILYFILLFLFSGMTILFSEPPVETFRDYYNSEVPLILRDGYVVVPMLMSVIVPLVTGTLLFRYLHSKKASVFVHSLPVNRRANYISTVLAGLTLMAVPVILNTGILIIMSLTSYAQRFTAGDCLTWMCLNLFSLFVMFGCSAFIASITGNSFGLVGLSVLFHASGPILIGIAAVVCNVFAYGFSIDASVFEKLLNLMPIYKIPEIMVGWGAAATYRNEFYTEYFIGFLIFAAVLYIIAGFLCSRRRVETAEDVAGFRCLNHIFKYLVTFLAAAGMFAILSSVSSDSGLVLWLMVIIISAVAYFGSEMLLKKSFRVVKASYKGYLAFAAVFAALMCLFAFSDFFGYETYIPDKSDIKAVRVVNGYVRQYHDDYDDEYMLADENMIDKALNLHRAFVDDREVVSGNYRGGENIHIKYRLKNGEKVTRTYCCRDNDEFIEIMSNLYENEEYKKAAEEIFTTGETTYRIELKNHGNLFAEIKEPEQIKTLLNCLQRDVMSLSYTQLQVDGFGLSAEVSYIVKDESADSDMTDQAGEYSEIHYRNINSGFTNTINWMKENGYWETGKIHNVGAMYIKSASNGNNEYAETVDFDKFLKVEKAEDIDKLIEFAHTQLRDYIPEDEAFEIIHRTDLNSDHYFHVCQVKIDEIKELLPDFDLSVLK